LPLRGSRPKQKKKHEACDCGVSPIIMWERHIHTGAGADDCLLGKSTCQDSISYHRNAELPVRAAAAVCAGIC
jgi:hypothetical protein